MVCATNRRGYATPENRSPAEIVVDATDGFVPLWAPNVTLRWQFDDQSMEYFQQTDQAKDAIRTLMGEALLAWGDASPVRFDEHDGVWDFRVVMREADRCTNSGCVLASAFFPDPGRNELVLYPELFDQSREEVVETFIHEFGHVFGLRHYFANIDETRWASEIFGTHAEFSIMNYGHKSTLTEADRKDLRRLYHLAWSGQINNVNGTPIRFFHPFSSSAADQISKPNSPTPTPLAASRSSMSREHLGQSLNLSEELIARGRRNRPGTRISLDYITVHNTDNTDRGADAKAHSRFVRNTGYYTLRNGERRWVSWHYTVDDKRVIKQLPVREMAYHAGRGNSQSIAIETCMHAGIDQDAANDRLARLVAVLRHDFNIERSHVVPHKHWTRKNCPRLLLPIWDDFLDKVDGYLESMRKSGRFDLVEDFNSSEDADLDHEAIAKQVSASIVEDTSWAEPA